MGLHTVGNPTLGQWLSWVCVMQPDIVPAELQDRQPVGSIFQLLETHYSLWIRHHLWYWFKIVNKGSDLILRYQYENSCFGWHRIIHIISEQWTVNISNVNFTSKISIRQSQYSTTWDSKCLALIAQMVRAFGMNPKVGGSSPPQVETFSVSKTLTLSQEHSFLCRKWMLLPAHS